jgi:hypothetical protein
LAPVNGRIRLSWWWLWTLLGFGVTTWGAFLYIGLQARRRAWLWAAAGYGVAVVPAYVLLAFAPRHADGQVDNSSWQANTAGGILLVVWIVGLVHGLYASGAWLEWSTARWGSRGSAAALAGATSLASPAPPAPRLAPTVARPGRMEAPWSGFVDNALVAQRRCRDSVARTRPGPFRDALESIVQRIDGCVDECRAIAGRGNSLALLRRTIDTASIDRAFAEVNDQPANPRAAQTLAALQAQRSTADRIGATVADVYSQLQLLDARLGEAAIRVLELSAEADAVTAPPSLSGHVDTLLADMEALRLAVDELDHLDHIDHLDHPTQLEAPRTP